MDGKGLFRRDLAQDAWETRKFRHRFTAVGAGTEVLLVFATFIGGERSEDVGRVPVLVTVLVSLVIGMLSHRVTPLSWRASLSPRNP
ncbi:hypothetical protein ASL10_04040 [Frigoribacterium sp. Leaf8]|nr:hypothetical protein ASL10_04040 [Frigoribacterium sp. Leaf8]